MKAQHMYRNIQINTTHNHSQDEDAYNESSQSNVYYYWSILNFSFFPISRLVLTNKYWNLDGNM
jgi:hypothetical protein